MIEFRRLTHEDYEDILDISKDIWEGNDYLPKVFHTWVDDKGIFLGAIDVERDKVVALAKLSLLGDGTGWLEGLRVHIDYRGQKLAKSITEKLLEQAKQSLHKGNMNRIAFSTYIDNIESRTMMEKLNFHIVQAHTLAIKNVSALLPSITERDFTVEPWDISYEDFKNHEYFKKRNGLLPLAFVFQEITHELYNELKKSHCFIKIEGHIGIFKYKGEPNFLAMEDTYNAVDTFMNYYLLKYKDEGIDEIYTPLLTEDKLLIGRLKASGYYSWSDWQPDYLYYVYKEHNIGAK